MDEAYLDAFWKSPEVAAVRSQLASARVNVSIEFYGPLQEKLAEIKARADSTQDEALAKAVWCLEQIAKVQLHYL